MTAAPVDVARPAGPVESGALLAEVAGWLRDRRHGSGTGWCGACERDAVGLVGRLLPVLERGARPDETKD